jgi:hypothetical protein
MCVAICWSLFSQLGSIVADQPTNQPTNLPTYLTTHPPNWLTLQSTLLFEKLIVAQLFKIFLASYGSGEFVAVFKRAYHLSLSRAILVQVTPSYPISLRFILILSNLCLGLSSGLFPACFLTKTLYAFLFSPSLATCPTHSILCDLITGIMFGEVYKSSVQLVGIRLSLLGGGLKKHCD